MSRGTILLVEDYEDDVFAFTWALGKTQAARALCVATDGRQAIAYLAGSGEYADREMYPIPCIVFLDLKLPYLNGHEVLAWIRQQTHFPMLPVIILSGSDEERDHKAARVNCANGYLVKPVRPDTLNAAIELHCGRLNP